ncbi:MAG: hypothetical protein IKL10_04135 [Clostridia bacterium]|nr:hypothetical protein [Clostridia bacterium]
MFFSDIEIPENTRKAVNSAATLGRIPCSILLSGGSASLREKCALELASAVLCTSISDEKGLPCGKCSACLRVKAGIHPDVFKVVPEDGKKLLSIKTVRESCLSRLSVSPTEGKNKVFLFPECDELQTVVQNALLKSIEEPPDDTMFIFCVNAREGLLTTVISRLTEYPLGDTLSSKSKKDDEKIIEIADGIAHALSNGDEFSVMLACAPMYKNRKMMASVAKHLIAIIRDAMAQNSGAPLLSGSDMAAYALSRSYKISSLLQIKEIMDKIISEASSNANENLLISRFSSETAVIMKDRI